MSGQSRPVIVALEGGFVILTIGHSTRQIGDFTKLLFAHDVKVLVDVRTVPRSRHNPQFNRDTLPETLSAEGIRYTHMPGLGGLRHSRADSRNSGWHNDSFRGFADYMQSGEFAENIEKLMEFGRRERVAIICA
jgi:uncharacterized protein (DUF488 family)